MAPLLVFLLAWSFFTASLAQQCYYQPDQVAGSAYLPCTQPGFSGFVSCCGLGHICLDDNACWDPEFNVTYLYGCTDPTYQDQSCPGKCDFGSIWTGLAYCNGTSDEWVCCPTEGDFPKSVAHCACGSPASRLVAFAGPSVLSAHMILPTIAGGSISYLTPTQTSSNPGIGAMTMTVMATVTPSGLSPVASEVTVFSTESPTASASASASASSTTSTTNAPASSSHPTSVTQNTTQQHASSGLSSATKVKVGLGAGVPAFVLFFSVLLWSLVRWLRHRRAARNAPPIDEQIRPQSQQFANDKRVSGRGADSRKFSAGYESLAGVGAESELPADNEIRSPPSLYHTLELGSGRDNSVFELPG